MEKFSFAWWHIIPLRALPEPDGEKNKQLVSEFYESSDKTGNGSLEDYRRVVSSIELRSLKDKTQVFPLDQEHHVRTRLSHSFEVATTASSILEEILSRNPARPNNARRARIDREKGVDESIGSRIGDEQAITSLRYSLMAACLLHDGGNPPFGHFGEQVIGSWFSDNEARYCPALREGEASRKADDPNASEIICEEGYRDLKNFEGNANSLRIALCPSGMYDGRRLNLTATTLFSVVKYPWLSSSHQAIEHKGKFNCFLSDRKRAENFIQKVNEQVKHDPKGQIDILQGDRHPLSFILEASDDISYVSADFEDAFRKGLFSVGDIVRSYAEEPIDAPVECKTYPATIVHLLVILAGSKDDSQLLSTLCPELPSLLNGEGTHSYLENGDKHTFQAALRDNPSIARNAHQCYQLQETYVSRWVDIVRRWLRFSAAGAIAQSDIFCGSREKLQSCAGIDSLIFGNHYGTVEFLKMIMKKYVYDSPQNTKLNLTANTVLKDLLDKFVPAAIHCGDPVDIDSSENEKMKMFEKALVLSIPLRFRLDYQERRKASGDSWRADRDRYERVMMALDYLTSMTDGFAVQLHAEIC